MRPDAVFDCDSGPSEANQVYKLMGKGSETGQNACGMLSWLLFRTQFSFISD